MKHYSGIDYDHFLDNVRDMYPFSVLEAILTELIANALDAKTSLIDLRVDPENRILEIVDNGSAMDKRGFEMYHNFSTSFKRKGHGIGFAGLGAKLALKVSDSVVTETRQTEGTPGRRGRTGKPRRKSAPFWGTSEWKFERRGKVFLPVWYDIEAATLTHHGTRVRIHFKPQASAELTPEEVRRIVLRHYLPLLRLREFYETVGLYPRMTILVNGEVLEEPAALAAEATGSKRYMLRRGATRKPFAFASFEIYPDPLPEDLQGIAIATFGKVIKREYLKQHFAAMERVTGIIEVPELVECLTTNKYEFRKEGAAGARYYRLNKVAQQEFRRWLEELQLLAQTEARSDRDTQKLQRVINRIVGEMPDLQQFYGSRGERTTLVNDEGGSASGSLPDPPPRAEADPVEPGGSEELIEQTMERVKTLDRSLQEGGEIPAAYRPRTSRFGPVIRHIAAPGRDDISWMDGDTVFINTAHSTYQKSVQKKIVEYHTLFAAALAMLREVPTATEKLELLEKFMSRWGKL